MMTEIQNIKTLNGILDINNDLLNLLLEAPFPPHVSEAIKKAVETNKKAIRSSNARIELLRMMT